MNEGIGAKGGKKDRKLSFLNRRRKIQLKRQEEIQKKEKEKKQKIEKKEEEIILVANNQEEIKTSEPVVQEKQNPPVLDQVNNIIDFPTYKKEKEVLPKTEEIEKVQKVEEKTEEVTEETVLIDYSQKRKKRKGKNTDIKNSTTHNNENTFQDKKIDNIEDFLEKQIIKVLEQDIQEKKYQLKKIDSEIHAIQKSIESTTDEEELEEIEKEIERLMDMLEQIKRQILSLEKTFDFNFPVEEPDNYLIYLVEEYKNRRKEEKEFYKKLQDNKEFQSLIDALIDIEQKQEVIQEKAQDKKDQLELEEDQVEKLNEDVINIEEMNKSIKKMIEEHENMIVEITQRVNETVHITESVDYISKSVDHTMLELFLLMALLKHNLSIKNNAIAAATAALTLNAIIKMTTPIQEKIIVKDNDFKDYETMIRNCMNDTGFLEKMIHNNLDQISSIRYTFEKEYQSCSYLPSYQDALKKLDDLEDDMKERKNDVAKMKRDIELQLEKNNAKVKKYGSKEAA